MTKVDVVSGFLGAGKTTLIQKLIKDVFAALRSGLTLIPCIILLNAVFGLSGLEKAQSIAEILSVIITIPFLYYFFRHQPEDGQAH